MPWVKRRWFQVRRPQNSRPLITPIRTAAPPAMAPASEDLEDVGFPLLSRFVFVAGGTPVGLVVLEELYWSSQDHRSAFVFSMGCKAYGDSSRTTVVTGNVVDARITGV